MQADPRNTTGHGGKEFHATAPGNSLQSSHRYATFYLADRLYGISVTLVQEVVKPLALTRVPLAPAHIAGLINLRGQIATAIGLRELFKLEPRDARTQMNIVCKCEGVLLSLLVDEIGDVIDVADDQFERIPATIDDELKRFLSGVFKLNTTLLSVVDLEPITQFLGIGLRQRA